MKVKKTSRQIKDRILDELKNGPKTIAEISEKIKSNWLTTEKFLKELKDESLVIEVVSSPKMKFYRRTDDVAFYGLPFSKEIRDNNASLLCTIAKKWEEKKGTAPSKTILQKIAVELIEKSNGKITNIPVLRFHYGKTTALRYDEKFEKECKIFNLSSEQNTLLLGLINKYQKMSAHKVQIEQYEKKGMEFYLIKEQEIINNFSSDNIKKLENSLLKFSAYYPSELQEIFPFFDNFIYCSINVLNLNKTKDQEEYLNKLKEIFYLLWDAITTSYFFLDAERWIEQEKKELFNQIKNNIINSKISNISSILEDFKSEVDSINPENIGGKSTEKTKKLFHAILED